MSECTGPERHAYQEALRTIQPEMDELRRLTQQLDQLPQRLSERPGNSSDTQPTVHAGGMVWHIQSQLLKLSKSEIFLCRQAGGDEFAVIQRFEDHAPYAKANGSAEIISTGNDARQLISTYGVQARHTLRFMASNLVAKAQKTVWEKFSRQNPARVVRAVSGQCARIVSQAETLCRRQHREHRMSV